VRICLKELEVLELLASRLSRREIASGSTFPLNTMKTRFVAVYRKLDVEDRNTAVKPGTRARPALTYPTTREGRPIWAHRVWG